MNLCILPAYSLKCIRFHLVYPISTLANYSALYSFIRFPYPILNSKQIILHQKSTFRPCTSGILNEFNIIIMCSKNFWECLLMKGGILTLVIEIKWNMEWKLDIDLHEILSQLLSQVSAYQWSAVQVIKVITYIKYTLLALSLSGKSKYILNCWPL